MNTCKNCSFWGAAYPDADIPSKPLGAHRCMHPSFGGGCHDDLGHEASNSANTYMCVGTGPDFGCILFAANTLKEVHA